ncbi:hypothetical protein DPMN_034687 [Dreissena polymorpha]|uniref:Uncharacterized protein n=1 Tax=Dreissena polymorpha TaxID=45954 RepID=A0A9D4RKA4_DREPO|nr:hypothetical protein DPMN_034687 [Dreissena polymorpha]
MHFGVQPDVSPQGSMFTTPALQVNNLIPGLDVEVQGTNSRAVHMSVKVNAVVTARIQLRVEAGNLIGVSGCLQVQVVVCKDITQTLV